MYSLFDGLEALCDSSLPYLNVYECVLEQEDLIFLNIE
jgi:hypothetical protein